MNTRTMKKGKSHAAAQTKSERKLKHRSRAELQKALPRVREGRPLAEVDDERAWLDW